jgi:GNAT superfamily N-acetyltransferase
MAIVEDVIRPMTPVDLEPAADLLRRGDFGERLPFLSWALDHPALRLFIAEADGRIIGTGTGSAHGRVGWIGVIFVAADQRGSGLGGRITDVVIDDLEARGCRTQLLIASPMGRPLYERRGFRELDWQVRLSIDGLPPDDRLDRRIRPFRDRDLEAVVALDRFATGEDRRAVLEGLVTAESTLVAVDGTDNVRGYLIRPPWRGGALIAPDPADALRLLECRRRSTGVSGKAGAGVLASNVAGRSRLAEAGWHEEMGNVRMIRGEPLDWHPDAIFGQLNGALG